MLDKHLNKPSFSIIVHTISSSLLNDAEVIFLIALALNGQV